MKLREDAIKREHRLREEELKRQFEAEQETLVKEQQEKLMRASMDSAMDLAADLNVHNRSRSKKMQYGRKTHPRERDAETDFGIFSDGK